MGVRSLNVMNADSVLVLGRTGDVICALPIALDMSRRLGRPVPFVVSRQFASILEGCSYVKPVIFDGDYREVESAVSFAILHGLNPAVAQWYGYRTEKTQSNFEREAWVLAGYGEKWASLPTVFDQRNETREWNWVESLLVKDADFEGYCQQCGMVMNFVRGRCHICTSLPPDSHPMIAVSLESHSSPLPEEVITSIMNGLSAAFPEHQIVNISSNQAPRFFDVLKLLEVADCLITVDTAALHLARASTCPVVAIVNDRDGGWWASDIPPQTIHAADYSEGEGMVGPIIHAVANLLDDKEGRVGSEIIQVTALGPRVKGRAISEWATKFDRSAGQIVVWNRGSSELIGQFVDSHTATQNLNDPRDLCRLRQLLTLARLQSERIDDIVMWMNDDTDITPAGIDILREQTLIYGATSIRRDDQHMGREVFAFTWGWLQNHMEEIPDFYVGAPCFDLCLAAIIRLHRGIVTTRENITTDFFPCEISQRVVIHEDHQSAWTKFEQAPANVHNRRLAKEWFVSNGMSAFAATI